MTKQLIYLDHAATTPVSVDVLKVMEPYFSQKFFNPSANYLLAKEVKADQEAARFGISQILGVNSSTITFTAGGTEANNLAIHGLMANYKGYNIVTSDLEHDSVFNAVTKYEYRMAKVKPDGLIDLDSLLKLIDDKTVLVTLMLANNEIGTIQPIKDLAKMITVIRQNRLQKNNNLPIYILTDACQAGNFLDLHINNLKVDFLTLNGSKIYGPKQSGVLYTRAGIKISPIIDGGGQENNLRSGTENVPFNIGLAEALSSSQSIKKSEVSRLEEIQSKFISKIKTSFPNVVVNGSLKNRLPSNVHLTFPNVDNERLLFQLDSRRILASAGSACSASSHKPSRVLSAMGINDELIRASIRLTMGRQTTWADMDRTIKVLLELIK